ncbi:MAG: CrcB family protein [Acidimicrobiia bacterium]
MTWVAVVIAGAIGSLTRYGVIGFVQAKVRDPRPWGTFVVNVTGAAVLGLVVGIAPVGWWVVPATAGFLGGYSTFSTWMVETIYLAEGGGAAAVRSGFLNLVGTLGVGLIAAAAGYLIGTWL